MRTRLQDAYSECVSDECTDVGHNGSNCGIITPSSFVSIRAECMRNRLDGTHTISQMCDCIIVDPLEEKISLVEIKSGTTYKKKTLRNAKRQLLSGLEMVVKILRDMGRSSVKLQAVIATNLPHRSMAMQKQFQKWLKGSVRARLVIVGCNCDLPNIYRTTSIPK